MDDWMINLYEPFKSTSKERSRIWMILLYSLLISLVFVINIFLLSWFTDLKINLKLLLFIGMIFMLYFVLNTILGAVYFRIKFKEQDARNQMIFNKSIEAVNSELADIKQGFDNSLLTIYGLVKDGQYGKVNELLVETNSQHIIDRKAYINMCEGIKNSGILGLVITKLDHMRSIGLNIKFIVHNEICEINMSTHHLCEVLGIILDNAIEAAIETEDKHIKLAITNEYGTISFLVENSTNKGFDFSKAFDLGWSTKGNQRGMGLWIARNIIRKYRNVSLNTFIDGNRVRQELIILSK